jgi:hypothetical protein
MQRNNHLKEFYKGATAGIYYAVCTLLFAYIILMAVL